MKLFHPHIVRLALAGAVATSSADAAAHSAEGKEREIFLETSVGKAKPLEGERMIYEVRLVSELPDIAGFEPISYPGLEGMPAAHAGADRHLEKIERKGKTYYTLVIDRYFIGADDPGKHTIKGGLYRIALNKKIRVRQPFGGDYMTNRLIGIELAAPEQTFNVIAVPSKGRPEIFSGAIGNFEISASMPEKVVEIGEKGILLVTVSGKGDVSNSPAPDVRQAFGEGLRFRSMTDERQHYIIDGSLGSEMVMEVTFTPLTPGQYTISPISFCYFDPDKKKYITISTDSVEVEVVEGCPIDTSPPVIHEI